MSSYGVKVEVRGEIPKGYRLKVSLIEAGMYIDGFKAYPSKQDDNEWFIAPPSVKVGSAYKDVIEFAKSKPLWREIVKCCENAILLYRDPEAEPKEILANVDF